MRYDRPTARGLVGVGVVLLLAPGAAGQGGPPGPKGTTKDPRPREEALILKAGEKAGKAAAQPGDTERDKWVKELGDAFPGRVGPGGTLAEVGQWFDLLAAGRGTWDREATPKAVAKLHDRASERLYGRPGQPIRRDEFLTYAGRFLAPGASPPWSDPELSAAKDAEKLFRELDADGDGALAGAEWTDGLRAARAVADRNRDGVIDRDEYRAYLTGRVAEAVAAPRPPAPPPGPDPPPRGAAKGRPDQLPAWFTELDTDRDGQVGLYEWRKAGRAAVAFVAMDLNGDGLLPPDEYRRYVRQAAGATADR